MLGAIGCGGPEAFRDPRHILLISVDTQRQDYLGTYGYEEEISPRIDQLASEAIVFENAVTVAGTTFPAHGSILTGLYPREHGAIANGFRLADGVPTVAEHLSAAGFRTGSFVSYPGMHKSGDLDRGFEAASDRDFVKGRRPIRPGRKTAKMAQKWLDSLGELGEERVFLWVHLFEPHSPHEVTPWSEERLSDYDGIFQEGATHELISEHRGELAGRPEDLRALRELYAGGVRAADNIVASLLDSFSERVGDDYVVILLADHGEALGEEGHIGHGQIFWESVIRIPMLLWDARHPEPRRVKHRVSAVDVTATIFELAGLDIPSLRGTSLIETARAEEEPERDIFVETAADNPRKAKDPDFKPRSRNNVAVYSGPYKFERLEGVESLYQQNEDLVFERLDREQIPTSVWHRLSSAASEFTSAEGLAVPADLDESDIETLRSLGYLQ